MLWLGYCATDCATGLRMPAPRRFFPIDVSPLAASCTVAETFRVLQLNMLADGLSGLRDDLGAFSRARAEDLSWDTRKAQLLYEILQYAPDVITLQECDHYYDFFLPELSAMGYDGLFAPKPSSACLEVSENSDGCAIFLKRGKFSVKSAETLTFALAKGDCIECWDKEEDRQVRAQNQVALVALCDLSGEENDQQQRQQLIICTTHLKATKNIVGERTRNLEVTQLLSSVQSLFSAKVNANGQEPLILITGDLNAAPDERSTGYQALAYSAVKQSSLDLRSVLNDDLCPRLEAEHGTAGAGGDIWTTWKARRKQGKESVSKSCIDYILYRPLTEVARGKAGLRAKSVLGLFSEAEIGQDLLPSDRYPSDHLAIAADLEVVFVKP
jgi:nocturnin